MNRTNNLFKTCCHDFSNVLFLGLLIQGAVVFAGETVVVVDVSRAKTTGELVSWSPERIVVKSESSQEFLLSDVRSMTFSNPVKPIAGGDSIIWLSNGDRISARAVKVENESLSISWSIFGATNTPVIPLEKISAFAFDLPISQTDRLRLFADIDTLPPGNDTVVLTNGDRSVGEFERLDAAFVELKGPKSSLKLDRSRVRAVRLNPELINVPKKSGRRTVVALVDGSRITCTEVELISDELKLKSVSIGSLTLPLKSIAFCQVYGERVIPITEFEPVKVEFTPYLSATWPLVKNANVLHGPLSLRGTEYTVGLGVHSRTEVTYELSGNELEFQSLVGIDDISNGAGSVVFAVELDGRRVWTSSNLTGNSPASVVSEVNLHGTKRMTLIVEFGEFADVSDYADWCDAVFVLGESKKTKTGSK